MFKKNKSKYFFLFIVCLCVFIYGFTKINITKPELVRKKSKFTIDLSLKPVDFRIETNEYIFYINNKVIDVMKEKSVNAYNDIFSK